MILPLRVFGRSAVKMTVFGRAIAPILLGDVLAELFAVLDARLLAAAQRDEGDDRLAGDLVLRADDRGLGDRRMVDTSDDSTSVVEMRWPRHVHHVVDAPEQPEVAVVVDLGAVAREVAALEPAPVRLLVALGVAVDAAQHRRPRPGEREVAAAAVDALAVVVDDLGADARAAGTSPSRASASSRRAAG